MDEARGFFASLFDFSFASMITGRIIRFLYVLLVAMAAVMALLMVVMAFGVSGSVGILALLIGAPLVFVISVIYARVMLEIIMVVFSISSNVSLIAGKKEDRPLD